MKMLPSASTYLLLGVLSWGSASPKSTGGICGFRRLRSRGRGRLLRRGGSCSRWELGAVEALAPAPGLTFGFTLRRALRNMAEPGGPGRRPQERSAPDPGRCPEGFRNYALLLATPPAQRPATRSVRPSHRPGSPAAASSS